MIDLKHDQGLFLNSFQMIFEFFKELVGLFVLIRAFLYKLLDYEYLYTICLSKLFGHLFLISNRHDILQGVTRYFRRILFRRILTNQVFGHSHPLLGAVIAEDFIFNTS